MTAAIGGKWEN